MSAIVDNSTCPGCGAPRGEACKADFEEVHSARIHEFIENGSYLARRQAHMETCAAIKAAGINIDERESLFLTDEEILGIYGESNG
jgi:hypothetical protein